MKKKCQLFALVIILALIGTAGSVAAQNAKAVMKDYSMEKTVKYQFKEHLITRQAKAEAAMLREFAQGDYTIEKPLIKYNPYIVNSLSAVILFRTEEETAITIKVVGKTEEASISQTFPKAKEHVIPIVGLYSNYDNKIEVYPYQQYSKKIVHTIKTPEVSGAKLVESMKTTPEYLQDNVIFLCMAVNDMAIAVDYAGDVRLNFTVPMVWGIKRLPNGNLLIGSERLLRMPYFVSGIYEISPVGKIYKEYRMPHGYHHDQVNLPNGDIVALSSDFDNGTVEDICLIIDKDTGHVKRTIYFKNFLKPGSQKSGSWSDEDWFHCNAVWYDEHSNSLTFSGRHINAMVNIDFDTEQLNWIISDPEGWPEAYHKYLFKQVGDGEFEWQYEQHSSLITPLGDVMCFDNHHYGSQNPDMYVAANDSCSRGVKYRIDMDKMEIEQLWQYGKERGKEFFSPYISNVIYWNEGHYMTHSGGIALDSAGNVSEILGPFAKIFNPNVRLESITVETINDKKMLELKAKSNYYRANKLTLYAKKPGQNNLKLGTGQILGCLGVTPQTEIDRPVEDTGQMIPTVNEVRVIDEMDMFTIEAKFKAGQMIILLLESDKETRRYLISTSINIPMHMGDAMCTNAFLTEDSIDTRTAITKDGMDGEYRIKIIIDDQMYDCGVVIKA